jgi:hypothetical protein
MSITIKNNFKYFIIFVFNMILKQNPVNYNRVLFSSADLAQVDLACADLAYADLAYADRTYDDDACSGGGNSAVWIGYPFDCANPVQKRYRM